MIPARPPSRAFTVYDGTVDILHPNAPDTDIDPAIDGPKLNVELEVYQNHPGWRPVFDRLIEPAVTDARLGSLVERLVETNEELYGGPDYRQWIVMVKSVQQGRRRVRHLLRGVEQLAQSGRLAHTTNRGASSPRSGRSTRTETA